jgi:hypothetical protein
MSRLKDLIGENDSQRMVDLFQILDNEETGNIDAIYKDMILARKIIWSRYNNLTVSNVKIRGVDYYNNNSERHINNNPIDQSLTVQIKKAIQEVKALNRLMTLRVVHPIPTYFHQVFCNYIYDVSNM